MKKIGNIRLTGKIHHAYFKKDKNDDMYKVDMTSSYPVRLLEYFETMDEKLQRRRPLRKEII